MIDLLIRASCATATDCDDTAAISIDAVWFAVPILVLGAALVVGMIVLARRGSRR